jgi:hypothetical protein
MGSEETDMKYKAPLLLLVLCLASRFSNAQQPAMSASTGLAPGNSFTLFVVFQSPTQVKGMGCAFALAGNPKPGQEDFNRGMNCSGPPTKDDDTHYRVKVNVPEGIATGSYEIQWISMAQDDFVAHSYPKAALPALAPVEVVNPKHLEFPPIRKLEIR